MPPPLDLIGPLLEGLWVTVQLTVGGAILALFLALVAGLGKLSPWAPARWFAAAYVEVFRGTSALVQLFWFFYALPLLGVNLPAMGTGVLVLGLNIGAYGAEIVRGAVLAVDRGQSEAATALNMTGLQRLGLVVLPQAAIAMLPPAGNLSIELLKSTALVSLITLSDLTFRGMILRAESLRTVEIFGLLLLLYFALAQLLAYGTRRLERRLAAGWHITATR